MSPVSTPIGVSSAQFNFKRHQLVFATLLIAITSGCKAPEFAMRTDARPGAVTAGPTFVEPIFEETELETFSRSATYGNVTTTSYWQDKVWLVKPEQRRFTYTELVDLLQGDGVSDTQRLQTSPPTGTVRVVRLALTNYQVIDSNQTLLLMSLIGGAMFPLCPPLIFAWGVPAFVDLHTEESIDVMVKVYDVDAASEGLIVDNPGFEYPNLNLNGARMVFQKRYPLNWSTDQGYFAGVEEPHLREAYLKKELAPSLKKVVLDALSRAGAQQAPAPVETPAEGTDV